MAESLILRKGAEPTLQIQVGYSTQVNNLGTVNIDKDLGEARPCYAYAYGYNRWEMWIYGSNDNSTWTQLGYSTASNGRYSSGQITVSTSSYRYIRASARGINNGGDNILAMSVTYI